MKDWIKKYWWVLPFILLLPFVINFILLIPAFSPIVGENTDWLSFWGGYLGAIISAGVAFAILYIQRKDNEKQYETNRKLQLDILLYQQEMQWFNELKLKSIEYHNAFDQNDIIKLCNLIHKNKKETIQEAEDLIKILVNNNNKVSFAFEFLFSRERDEEEKNILLTLQKYNLAYQALICDVQFVVRILKKHEDPNQLFLYIDDYRNENRIPQITENRLVDIINNFNNFFLTEYTNFINQLFRARGNFHSTLIQKTLSELVSYEENKINKIIKL